MANLTHPKMMKGREVSRNTNNAPQHYVVENMQDTNLEETDLDDKLAQFEGTAVKKPVGPAIENKPLSDDKINKSLENLIFIGRHTKEIELGGHKFELSTLTHRENNEIISEMMSMGDAADLFTIRVLTLAFALRKIDGVALDNIPMDVEFDDKLQKRMTIVDYLQLGVVERLHLAYDAMVKESSSAVFGEEVKN
jgi:hypothetical protein